MIVQTIRRTSPSREATPALQRKLNIFGSYCVCTGCWNSFVNTNVANGEGRNATTLDACKTACVSNSSCTGFDWVTKDDQGKQCWLSGPWSGARNDGGMTGVNHYDFDRSCQGQFNNGGINLQC